MTDKTDSLLQALDNPSALSDRELHQLLSDPEVRQTYRLLQQAGDALTETPEPDVDAEWHAFVGSRMRRRSFMRRLLSSHRVGVVAAILAVSMAVVATTMVINRNADGTPAKTSAETSDEKPGIVQISASQAVNTDSQPIIVVFKDESLDSIVSSLCTFYGATANFASPDARNLRLYFRWNHSDSLSDIVEHLNSFEHINIALEGNTITVE